MAKNLASAGGNFDRLTEESFHEAYSNEEQLEEIENIIKNFNFQTQADDILPVLNNLGLDLSAIPIPNLLMILASSMSYLTAENMPYIGEAILYFNQACPDSTNSIFEQNTSSMFQFVHLFVF